MRIILAPVSVFHAVVVKDLLHRFSVLFHYCLQSGDVVILVKDWFIFNIAPLGTKVE